MLLGAAMRADEGVFHEAWAKMRAVEAVPTEGTLEAFLLMESKIGTWRGGSGVVRRRVRHFA